MAAAVRCLPGPCPDSVQALDEALPAAALPALPSPGHAASAAAAAKPSPAEPSAPLGAPSGPSSGAAAALSWACACRCTARRRRAATRSSRRRTVLLLLTPRGSGCWSSSGSGWGRRSLVAFAIDSESSALELPVLQCRWYTSWTPHGRSDLEPGELGLLLSVQVGLVLVGTLEGLASTSTTSCGAPRVEGQAVEPEPRPDRLESMRRAGLPSSRAISAPVSSAVAAADRACS
ncbi:unnamed protein product [Prorocentrum cordatum]|uniref:Uncharacterized protein n=1 Tax=Prorocentrum cordatum TaxID=2364126 RepID=A0ABN9XWF6_9DINO|nr:unnamed protein product [Polarella glacialis]